MLSNNIISRAMRKHTIILSAVIILSFAGIYALMQMNKDEFPQFVIRQGLIVGVYPGATPLQVEEQLTKPLESFLFTYKEIDKSKTSSITEDGRTYIYVELMSNVQNKDEVWSKIRHGLKDFQINLPTGVLAVAVIDNFGDTSSILISMESNDKSHRELSKYANILSDKLRTVPSMGDINIIGTQKEEINVYIRQDKLASYGISSKMLLAELYTQGLVIINGNFSNNQNNIPIHLSGGFSSEAEIANQIIYTDINGNIIRLRDIAYIERSYPQASTYVTKNDNNTIVLSVSLRPGNNMVQFGGEVDKILNEFKNDLPQSIQIKRITDQPKVVSESVTDFLKDLVISIFIVIFVMMLLFPLRSALVASLGIPICTAITLLALYLFKIELNTVTLAGLIFVLGMIVDNAIVIIDGYIERLNAGHSRWYAAVDSAKELSMPLLLATVAICCMFFPVTETLSGYMKDFIVFFPWTITVSLLISLLFAIFVVPYLEYMFIRPNKQGDKINLVERGQNWFFSKLQQGFEWLLSKCFKYPKATVLIAIGTILLGGFVFLQLNIQLMPKADRDCFAVEIRLPKGSSTKQTAQITDSLQKILKEDNRITDITAFIGSASPRFHATYTPSLPSTSYAQLIVNTKSAQATEKLLKEYTNKYVNYFPNAYVRFKQLDYQAVINPVEIYFKGDDLNELQAQSKKLETFMRDSLSDYLLWPYTDLESSQPFVKIELKSNEASRLGITQAILSLQLATAYAGQPLSMLYEDDYGIAVKLRTIKNKNDLEDIENLMISTSIPDLWVPLRQIATVKPEWQFTNIGHRNGIRCVTVSSDLKRNISQPQAMKHIKKYIENTLMPQLPPTVKISYGGLNAANEQIGPEIAAGVILAALVIFIFLIIHFGKIDLSILSLAATLLCLFGAFLGIYMFDLDFGLTSVLGIVSLIGIIVRNGIIMFEYAEDLRTKHKKSAFDAAFEAGKRRMRPIFLTSATTAVGVVPMIISASSLWQPMGVIICFGTILSIILIVTILPVMYWLLYNKKSPRKNKELYA